MEEVAEKEPQVRGPFSQTPREIRIPFGTKWHINTNRISFAGQLLLQITPNAVEKLELERSYWQSDFLDVILNEFDAFFIMSSDRWDWGNLTVIADFG